MKRLLFYIAISFLISCTANKSIKYNDKNFIMPPFDETIDRKVEGFNDGKAFAISINTKLVGYPKQFEAFCKDLHRKNLINFIAFEEFKHPNTDTLNIMIGSKVSLEISQAVIDFFAKKRTTPVVITSMPLHSELFYNQERIYIGGIATIKYPQTNQETIKALLKAKNLVAFHQLLPKEN